MTRRRRWPLRIAVGIGVVLLGVGAFIVDTLYFAGAFKTIAPHFAGQCRSVAGAVGVEDAVAAPDGRHAFLSADDRRSALAGHPVPGGIWLYELGSGAPPTNLTPQAGDDFHPHGMGFWPAATGGRLFVINHPDEGRVPLGQGRQVVEVYEWNGESLDHRAAYSDPLIRSPNAVVPTGANSFYVSNDHGSPNIPRVIEEYLRLPRADLVYFDGKEGRIAASGISFANGVELSADGHQLYLASTLGRALLVYDRDVESNILTLRQTVSLGTVPDNLRRASDGSMWIGAHPQALKLVAHMEKPENLSPSQVLRVTAAGGGEYRVDEIFLDDGRQLSGSSVGLPSGKHLLIGPVAEAKFLDCTMN